MSFRPRRLCITRPELLARLGVLAMSLAVMAPPPAPAAPEFVLSGLAPTLEKVTLARDGQGDVSALDVLLYLDIARRTPGVPAAQWVAPVEKRDKARWAAIRDSVEEFLAARSLARGAVGVPAQSDFLRRAHLFTAAEAAWIDIAIKPEISISPVDVERAYIANQAAYAAPGRAEVRYIFLPIEDTNRIDLARVQLDALGVVRSRIQEGELTFEDAARQFSKAPSGALGGLIPEFARGTWFEEFEFQAFSLRQAGQMSPVFLGNEGAYLLQLVRATPSRRIPFSSVREEITRDLRSRLIAPYHKYFADDLVSRHFLQDLSRLWPYSDLSAPIAITGGKRLERDQLLALNPSIINAGYEIQWGVIQQETVAWIEGETILAALEKRGLGDHPYIQRARAVSQVVLASRAEVSRRLDRARFDSIPSALRTLGLTAGAEAGGFPQSRVIQVALVPSESALRQTGRAEVVRQMLKSLTSQIEQGILPTGGEAPVNLAGVLTEATDRGEDELAAEISRLMSQVKGASFADIELGIEDIGWKDALPLVAWNPSLPGLKPGQMSPPQVIGNTIYFFYVAATRLDPKSPWIDRPLILRSLARDVEEGRILREETTQVQQRKLLTFDLN